MLKKCLALLLVASPLLGTQTALFWTYCTTDVLELGKANFEVANIFKIRNRHIFHDDPFFDDSIFASTIPESMLPVDIGLNFGIFRCGPWQVEAGIDYFAGTDNPIFFNAKAGVDECKLFWNAPSLSFGVFNVGTTHDTNFNVFDVVVGKTVAKRWGRVFAGGYIGTGRMGKDQAGWMVGYDAPFCKKTSHKGVDYYRWHFLADYASGRNIVGGGGVGVWYFINPDISISTGPTWFNSAKIFGTWKWALYINIVFPVWRKPKNCT